MLEIFSYIDLVDIFQLQNILGLFFGSFVGMLVGALPGLGQTIALIMVLPISYSMGPTAAIFMMLSCYQSSGYGGSISSITLGIPGTPASVATALDGHALSKKGSPGKALAYALFASAVGGLIGGIIVMFLSNPMASFALNMSEPEYFLIAILGLIISVTIISKDFIMGLISAVFGLLISTIGTDLQSSVKRFTFGKIQLTTGIEITALLVGTFALTEIFIMALKVREKAIKLSKEGMSTKLTLEEVKEVFSSTVVGSVVGVFTGVVPGLGGPTAAWLGYASAERLTKNKLPFGEGNPSAIAGPESANNGAVGGNMIPLVIFGIPGNPMMAIILGAFMIQGIQPGAKIFIDQPKLIYTILFGFLLTSIVMYIVGRGLTPVFARFLAVPNRILFPIVLLLCILGVYASSLQMFNVWLAIGIGIISFTLIQIGFSIPAFVLAYVLGPLAEGSLRRSLKMYGNFKVFIQRPLSIFFLVIIIVIIITVFVSRTKKMLSKKDSKDTSV